MPEKVTKKVKVVREEMLIPVTAIMNDRFTALVEYSKNGLLTRATIQSKYIVDGQVKETILDKAVKHGIDWREIKFPPITETEINRQLRNHGIWTAEDVRTKPGTVSKAVMQACAPLVSIIFEFAKNK
jgi:hypothetical protein